MDAIELRKILENNKDFLIVIKEQVEKAEDGIIRVKTKDVGGALGIEDNYIDLYYGLRTVLFDDDIVVGASETRDGDMVLIFRKREDDDQQPESKDDEIARYQKLEGEIVGLSEIAKMKIYNEFDPAEVVNAIREHRDAIAIVRSVRKDKIGIFLKENLGDKKVRDIMITLAGLNADELSSENDEIFLWWD